MHKVATVCISHRPGLRGSLRAPLGWYKLVFGPRVRMRQLSHAYRAGLLGHLQ